MISKLNFLSLRPCKARNEIPRYWLIFLSLFMFASTAWAQERVVSGSVVSEAGNPLVGVSVQVKGTTTSASTDAQGSFSVDVNPGAVLVFSYIGFETREHTLGNETTLKITMMAADNACVMLAAGTSFILSPLMEATEPVTASFLCVP